MKQEAWKQLSKYAITNGKYFISKAFKDGVPDYTLWEGDKMIAVFKSAEAAKEAVWKT